MQISNLMKRSPLLIGREVNYRSMDVRERVSTIGTQLVFTISLVRTGLANL